MSYRQNTYTEGNSYRLLPVARMEVVPGQTLNAKVQAKVQTVAFLQNILSGGVAHIYAFYTPYRLLWEDWIDFASDPDTTTPIPTTTTSFDAMFEKSAAIHPVTVFGRRAYKLIYNQFFGSDQWGAGGGTWYDDITLDTDVSMKPLRSTDQFSGKILQSDQAPDRIYPAPVTGTAPNQVANVSLNEFRSLMNQARSDRRAQMTGDKYVDAMRRLGVNLDWRVQMAPEFLGQSLVEFDAKRVRSSYGDDTALTPLGRAYAHYEFTLGLDLGKKFFAEHGTVIFCIALRPYVFPSTTPSPVLAQISNRTQLFWGDNQEGVTGIPATVLGLSGAEGYVPRFQYYQSGQNLFGNTNPTAPWITSNTPTGLGNYVYTPDIDTTIDDTLGGNFAAAFTRLVADGPSPIRKMRI